MAKWEVDFDGKWTAMDRHDSNLLEARFQEREGDEFVTEEFSFDHQGNGYKINFSKMTQTNTQSQYTRAIRRQDTPVSTVSILESGDEVRWMWGDHVMKKAARWNLWRKTKKLNLIDAKVSLEEQVAAGVERPVILDIYRKRRYVHCREFKTLDEAIALIEPQARWIKRDGLPVNEGCPHPDIETKGIFTLKDMKHACMEYPDCVGFSYRPADRDLPLMWLPKKNSPGFDPDTDVFSPHAEGEKWEYHYIVDRAQASAPVEAEVFVVIYEKGVPVNETKKRNSPEVTQLPKGTKVEVLEFAEEPEDGRVRARIASPEGWITTKMAIPSGTHFVAKETQTSSAAGTRSFNVTLQSSKTETPDRPARHSATFAANPSAVAHAKPSASASFPADPSAVVHANAPASASFPASAFVSIPKSGNFVWRVRMDETPWNECSKEDSIAYEDLFRAGTIVEVDRHGKATFDFHSMTKTTHTDRKVIELQHTVQSHTMWACNLGVPNKAAWTICRSGDSKMLEEKYTMYLNSSIGSRFTTKDFTFNEDQTDYEIDFDTMTQKNMKTGVSRELRRTAWRDARWHWRAPVWEELQQNDIDMLENRYTAFTQGKERVFTTEFSFGKTKYEINLGNMSQTNLETQMVRDLDRRRIPMPCKPNPQNNVVPKRAYACDIFPGTKEGPGWKDDPRSPMFVPVDFRTQMPDDTWLMKDWETKEDGTTRAWNEVPIDCLQSQLSPFKQLDPNGSEWEKSVFRMLHHKLHGGPKDCGVFGSSMRGISYVTGFEWEIKSVHLIYDETRLEKFSQQRCIDATHECDLFFHGTRLHVINLIVRNGFRIAPPGSGMWFGNGAYFTNCIPYAQHYVGRGKNNEIRPKDVHLGFQLPRVGNTIYIIGALLKPGRVFEIPADTTPAYKPYASEFRDRDGVEEGYDSHAAYVSPSTGGKVGFRPVDVMESKGVEEWVMFDQDRMLPRFIIGVTLKDDHQPKGGMPSRSKTT